MESAARAEWPTMTFSCAWAGAFQKTSKAVMTKAADVFMGFPHVSVRSFACKDRENFTLGFALEGKAGNDGVSLRRSYGSVRRARVKNPEPRLRRRGNQ